MDTVLSDRNARHVWWRWTAVALMLASTVAVMPVVIAAFRSARGIALPHPLAIVLQKLPVLFPVHMAASASALLLVPLAVASSSLPHLHRWIGRAAATFIGIGGLAALAVATGSVATPLARAGFFCQALVWLCLALSGVWAIRRKRRALHARLMRATAIVTFSPVLLRLLLPIAVSSPRSFGRTYALLAWGVWLVPLLVDVVVEAVRLGARQRSLAVNSQLVGARQVAGPTYLNSALIGNSREL